MLSRNKFVQIISLMLLILLQVVIFSNINFMGFANPLVYFMFILLLPLDTNRYLYLFYAFVIGLSIDFFEITGGINAFATVFAAFIRPFIVKLIDMGNHDEAENIKLFRFNFLQWLIYLAVLIFIHQFIVLFLEYFNLDYIRRILIQSAIGSSITLLIVAIYVILFPPKRTHEF